MLDYGPSETPNQFTEFLHNNDDKLDNLLGDTGKPQTADVTQESKSLCRATKHFSLTEPVLASQDRLY